MDAKMQAEYMDKRSMIEDFMRSVSDRLPPGRLDTAWEMWGQSEVGIAIDLAFDALEDLRAPLSDDEAVSLEAILQKQKNFRDEMDRWMTWARSCGRSKAQGV